MTMSTWQRHIDAAIKLSQHYVPLMRAITDPGILDIANTKIAFTEALALISVVPLARHIGQLNNLMGKGKQDVKQLQQVGTSIQETKRLFTIFSQNLKMLNQSPRFLPALATLVTTTLGDTFVENLSQCHASCARALADASKPLETDPLSFLDEDITLTVVKDKSVPLLKEKSVKHFQKEWAKLSATIIFLDNTRKDEYGRAFSNSVNLEDAQVIENCAQHAANLMAVQGLWGKANSALSSQEYVKAIEQCRSRLEHDCLSCHPKLAIALSSAQGDQKPR